MSVEADLAAMGHAQVIVVLKDKIGRRAKGDPAAALEAIKSQQEESARKVSKHFKLFRGSTLAQLSAIKPAVDDLEGDAPEYAPAPSTGVGPTAASRYLANLGVMIGTVSSADFNALRADDDVEAVISPPQLSLIQPEEDAALDGPAEGVSWAIRRLGIDQLWDRGLTGEDVLIGHLDTGVDATHPSLNAGQVDAFVFFDLSGRQVLNAKVKDSGYHGTHTAGILVGGPSDGVTFGTAPGAKLLSACVIEGGDIAGRVINALDWCVGQGVHVVNLSLGLRGVVNEFAVFLGILRQRNILPVVAIGNEGLNTSRTPGNLKEALSVGAMTEADMMWDRSSSHVVNDPPNRRVPSCIGPGAAIWSSVPGGGLRSLSGTSMAAPHIAGLAALLLHHRPEATIDQLERAIFASCQRPDGVATTRGNRGVPNAVEALARLR